jgi:CheY-like chemotaxis protein
MASVLIIEDDKALRESLAETLTGLGHHPIEADSGRVGLDIASQERLDAVLLDLRMPGMSGLEVLQHLRTAGGGSYRLCHVGEHDRSHASWRLRPSDKANRA